MSKCNFIQRVDDHSDSCCAEHDFQYSKEGVLSRSEADKNLLICVAKNFPLWAVIGWVLVRLFGWVYWERGSMRAIIITVLFMAAFLLIAYYIGQAK